MKSLVADDDYVNRMLMHTILEKYGRCDIASNGIEAVTLFLRNLDHSEPYDLICLDISMPKMDGLKALRIIRTLEQDLLDLQERKAAIIMATALDQGEAIHRAFDLGCEEFIVKPISIASFHQLMESLGLTSLDTDIPSSI